MVQSEGSTGFAAPAEIVGITTLVEWYGVRKQQSQRDCAAWQSLELAIAKAHKDSPLPPTPEEHFERAYTHFERLSSEPLYDSSHKAILLSQLALAARPAFLAIIEKRLPTVDEMGDVHRSQLHVARTAARELTANSDIHYRFELQNMLAATVGMAILSDLKDPLWFPRLTSLRERRPRSIAYLPPVNEGELPQPLAFLINGRHQVTMPGATLVDLGSIAACAWGWKQEDPWNSEMYDQDEREEGILATLSALECKVAKRPCDTIAFNWLVHEVCDTINFVPEAKVRQTVNK